LEVLISMFVLLIGLVGVGAMIPAGRFEIMQGVKLDYASMVGREALRDMKARGYLNPSNWQSFGGGGVFTRAHYAGGVLIPDSYSVSNSNSSSTYSTITPAVAIDPLGLAAGFGTKFPSGAAGANLTRLYPSPNVTSAILADPIFRCSDDVTILANANKDLPPTQQLMGAISKRSSFGNYSWLATVVTPPDQTAASQLTVSVAVFYKRDLSNPANSESTASVSVNGTGELILSAFTSSPVRPVKPGQWIMLMYGIPVSNLPPPAPQLPFSVPATFSYANWYRVVAADALNGTQQAVTVSGQELPTGIGGAQAWIFENVIGITERRMSLELN
jgi:hypothetical protein